MKRDRRAVRTIAAAVFVMALASACRWPWSWESGGGLSVELVSELYGDSVPAGVDLSVVRVVVKGTGPDGTGFRVEDDGVGALVRWNLEPGTWMLSAQAYDDGDALVGSGSVSATVLEGRQASAVIRLVPPTGTGGLTLHLDWPGTEVAEPAVTATLGNLVLDGILTLDPAISGASASYSSSTIPSGAYALVLTLYDGDYPVWAVERRVLVMPSLPTSWEVTIAAADLRCPPEAPTGLAVAAATVAGIVLRWDDMSAMEDGYSVERSVDGGSFVAASEDVAADAETWTDVAVDPAHEYAYRVRALDAWGWSAYSNETSTYLHGGGAFLAYRGRLYLMGGLDGAGGYSSRVYYATLADDGTAGAWTACADLPLGRAFAAAVGYGNFVYLLGGEDAAGPLDDVWFGMINADGSVGFVASSSAWQTNPRSLPEGRTRAAAAVRDGVLYLAGGTGVSGPVVDAWYAGVWRDGQVGYWYEAPGPDHGTFGGPALAVAGDLLVAAGGLGAGVMPGGGPCAVSSYSTLGPTGVPGEWTTVPVPPAASAFAVFAPLGSSLALAGGVGADAALLPSVAVLSFDAGGQPLGWTVAGGYPSFGAPSGASASRGSMYGIGRGAEADAPAVVRLDLEAPRADAPSIVPSSGWITTMGKFQLLGAPGDVIRYILGTGGTEPADPDASSTPYTGLIAVSVDTVVKARAFRDGMEPSEVARTAYRVRPGSLFIDQEATLRPVSGASYMTEYMVSGTEPRTAVWYELSVPAAGTYEMALSDRLDADSGFTAAVMASVFETVFLTRVRDSSGVWVDQRTGSSVDPIVMVLPSGSFWLLVETTDAVAGGSFGLRFATR